MNKTTFFFKDVTLLITHYNRSSSLKRLLTLFQEQNCSFEDVVVSDDGSKPEHLDKVRDLKNHFSFQLITSSQNKGLGNNINKGQDGVKTLYTLYVQEDFEPAANFAKHFKDAVNIMRERNDLDIIRFYAVKQYPYLKAYKNGYSEMLISSWSLDYTKIYYYSDNPHLRRSSFLSKFGRYPEGLSGDKTEYRMCISFIQKKGKGLFYNDYKSLFNHKNSEIEPSTMTRSKWTLSDNSILFLMRYAYRQIKYNFDILYSK